MEKYLIVLGIIVLALSFCTNILQYYALKHEREKSNGNGGKVNEGDYDKVAKRIVNLPLVLIAILLCAMFMFNVNFNSVYFAVVYFTLFGIHIILYLIYNIKKWKRSKS